MLTRLIFVTGISLSLCHAAPRTWRSADGSKSFEGDFIKREGTAVTVKPVAGAEITFDISRLHEDDQKWINLYHPVDASKKPALPESTGVFDDLNFGDSRQQVEEKLKNSHVVEPAGSEVKSSVFGGTSMDGEYRTKNKIGDLHASLYFSWGEADGLLNEISLRTEPLSAISYNDDLKMAWDDMIKILTVLHGEPVQKAPFPDRNQVPPDAIIASHIWKLEKGGTAMLGTSRAQDQYVVVVRFSKKSVQEIQKFQLGQ